MTPIFYARAAASVLPFVGPFVGLYNIYEVKNELYEVKPSVYAAMRAKYGEDSSTLSEFEKRAILDETNASVKSKQLLIAEKGRFYSICGAVGSVLSIAVMVTLVALRIIPAFRGIVLASCFVPLLGIQVRSQYNFAKVVSSRLGRNNL